MTELAPRHLVAPCGLDCSRCVGCTQGTTAGHAQRIATVLGDNFQLYADRLSAFNPAMKEYPAFRALLDSLAAPACDGCRSDNRTCLPECNVAACVSAKGVEFCFQCDEYSQCGKTGLTGALLTRWQDNNDRMAVIGIEAYIRELADKPRYP